MIPREYAFEMAERQGHYQYSPIGDYGMHAVFRLNGRLDTARMARAFRLTADVFPILGCWARENKRSLTWVRRDDLESLIWCDRVKCATSDADGELQDFYRIPCAPWDRNPIFLGRIFETPAGDILCFKSHHAASDATGFKAVIAKVIEVYHALQATPDLRVKPITEYSRGIGQILRGLSPWQLFGILLRTYREVKIVNDPPSPLGLPYVPGDLASRYYITHAIAAEKFRAARAYAKARGATVNDLMNALIGHAVLHEFGDGSARPMVFFNSVDLRRYRPSIARVEGTRNLSGVAALRVTPRDNAFDTLLEEFRSRGRLMRADVIGLGSILEGLWRQRWTNERLVTRVKDKWAKIAAYRQNGGKIDLPILLSNAGVLDPAHLKFEGMRITEAALIPFLFHHTFYFVYGTFEDRVTISGGFCNADTIRPRIESLFRRLDDQVEQIERLQSS